MRKTIAAVTVGLLLVAGQAVASNSAAVARVGDRVGARAADSSEFQAPIGEGLGGVIGAGAGMGLSILGVIVGIGILDQVQQNDEEENPSRA